MTALPAPLSTPAPGPSLGEEVGWRRWAGGWETQGQRNMGKHVQESRAFQRTVEGKPAALRWSEPESNIGWWHVRWQSWIWAWVLPLTCYVSWTNLICMICLTYPQTRVSNYIFLMELLWRLSGINVWKVLWAVPGRYTHLPVKYV